MTCTLGRYTDQRLVITAHYQRPGRAGVRRDIPDVVRRNRTEKPLPAAAVKTYCEQQLVVDFVRHHGAACVCPTQSNIVVAAVYSFSYVLSEPASAAAAGSHNQ